MSLHKRPWLGRLVTMLAAASCLIGILAMTAPSASAKVGTSAVPAHVVQVATAKASGPCYVPHYKVTGSGSAKNPCNYNVHAYAFEVPLQYGSVRLFNRSGQSVWVNYTENYSVQNYTPANWPSASEFRTIFYTQVTGIYCLNKAGYSVGCNYLHIVLREHDRGKSYDTPYICKSVHYCSYLTSDYYMNEGPVSQTKTWVVGGGTFETATKHLNHWGGVAFVSAVVGGHYVPNDYHVLGHRYSGHWRAAVHVDY